MLQLCHSISPLLGASALWYLKQVNQEHASEELEAIMGCMNWFPTGLTQATPSGSVTLPLSRSGLTIILLS